MATTTTNLGLTKPAYADTADIEVINGNMDILDAAANALEGGMAIIANNNNHAAVSKGQFVYVRKHSSLAEGLYKATSNIAANGTLSNSNLAGVSDGLGGEIASVANEVSSLSDQIEAVASLKPTIKRVSKNILKNGSNTFNYSEFGTLYDGQAFWVTIIGTNNSWRYAGVLFKDSTRTTITQITSAYLTVTADSTKLTVTNTHADYDMNVYVGIIGSYS